jgi:hypothetical protein
MSDTYGRVIPLFRDLDKSNTDHEQLMKLRYPPTGDPLAWVHHGPDTQSQAREWHGRVMADHLHTADQPGGNCRACGFPWWPDTEAGA